MQLLERDDVLQRLDDLLSAARDGTGHAVLVRGEAGIGKTSAVRALVASHLMTPTFSGVVATTW